HIACTRSACMFKLFPKSQPQHPSTALAQALAIVVFRLGSSRRRFLVLEQRGSYSGRQVTYFRVFDPVRVAERTRRVQALIDLDSHPELVLGSGHREQNGAIVLTPQDKTAPLAGLVRAHANRSDHADDQQLVFPNRSS